MSNYIKVDGIITGTVEKDTPEITGSITIGSGTDVYPGPYDVVPEINPQYLATQGKYLKDNLTVWGIPFTEVSNEHGTTIIIG